MKQRAIFLNGLTALYCGQRLLEADLQVGKIVAILCIHLIFYLSSQMIQNPKVAKTLIIVDLVYLGSLVGVGYILLIVPLVLALMEYSCFKRGWLENVVLIMIGVSMILIGYKEILANWFIYGILIVTSLSTYWDKMKLVQLTKENTELMGKVSNLGRALEHTKKEKREMAYITKVTERNQLAQKLHDKMGHLLAGNVMQLEAIKFILVKDQTKGLELLNRVIEGLRDGMEEIRFTLKDLKPATSENGLTQVKEILEDFKEKSGITSDLLYKGDLASVGLEVWFAIHENLKETLTNFMKYSSANQFEVRIEVMHQVIKVVFKDNGVVKQPVGHGLGLIGIEERTLGIGGKIIVNTENGFETIMLIKR
ncbi:MAG: histidine kinase [Niameybacter sp.]